MLEPVGDWFAVIVTQVLDVCLSGLVGDLRGWTPGLGKIEVGFFVACGSYGEMAWLWGICRGVWENGLPMGICRDVWGDASGVWPYGKTAIPYGKMACVWEAAESHGGAAKTYGKCHMIWEPAAHGGGRENMGNAAWGGLPGTWGGRQAAWGAKNHIKTRNMGTVAACGLCMFL